MNYADNDSLPDLPERHSCNLASAGLRLSFSGTTAESTPWHSDWLNFTDSEYYHRVRRIMLESGMGDGDVEMILANVWEDAWIRGNSDNRILNE